MRYGTMCTGPCVHAPTSVSIPTGSVLAVIRMIEGGAMMPGGATIPHDSRGKKNKGSCGIADPHRVWRAWDLTGLLLLRSKVVLRVESGTAPHACSGDRLSIYAVNAIAGCEYAGNRGTGGGSVDDNVALIV